MRDLNRHWLRRLLSGEPHFYIGGKESPYLLRWFVIPRNHRLNVYVHKFLRDDDDRALHDHPWWFVSVMLRGRYLEVTKTGTRMRRAPSIAFRPATWTHRVALIDGQPCWTLIVTGRNARHWGFHCPKGWVPWEKFTAPTDSGNIGLGCGEYA